MSIPDHEIEPDDEGDGLCVCGSYKHSWQIYCDMCMDNDEDDLEYDDEYKEEEEV